MHLEAIRDLRGRPAGLQPRPERLGQPFLLARRQPLQRAEMPPAHLVSQCAVGQQPEGDQVILAVHGRAGFDGAGFGQGEGLPGPAQRVGRVRERDGQPDGGAPPAEPRLQRLPPQRAGIRGEQQMRLRIVEAGENLRGERRRGRGSQGDRDDLLRQWPARGLGQVGKRAQRHRVVAVQDELEKPPPRRVLFLDGVRLHLAVTLERQRGQVVHVRETASASVDMTEEDSLAARPTSMARCQATCAPTR